VLRRLLRHVSRSFFSNVRLAMRELPSNTRILYFEFAQEVQSDVTNAVLFHSRGSSVELPTHIADM
jgi:hypothetical protein